MSETIQGLSIGLNLDTLKLDSGLKDLSAKMRLMNSEMKANMSAFDRGEKSVDKYQTQIGGLNKKLELQKEVTDKAHRSYEKMVAEHGEGSVEAEKAARAYNNESASLNNLERYIGTVSDELRALQDQQKLSGSEWTKMSEQLTATGASFTNIGKSMGKFGKEMSMKVTAPILAVGAASVKTAMDFEAQMSRVGAIAGATGQEMDALSASSLELGASTSKSASEVAIGMENLAAMGFNANEVIGAMPGVISAAEASGADMAQTADVMATALNIFGLEAAEATRVADVLAQTANVSAADMGDMAYALKYAGPPAAALGVSLEELSASIGIMTNAGMDGSSAGTSLRGSMLSLLNPSVKNQKAMDKMSFSVQDAEGNFVGLSKMVENLNTSMKGETETQKAATLAKLVGKESVSGMLSLMKAGPAVIDKMTKSLEESGGASAIAAAKMKDNLAGALDELGGTIETAAITIGTILTPTIQKAGEFIQSLVEKFQNLTPEGQKSLILFGGIAAAIGPLLVVGGMLFSSLGAIFTALGTVSAAVAVVTTGVASAVPAVSALAGMFTLLTGPVGLAIAAVALLGGGLIALDKHMDKPIVKSDIFAGKISEATQKAVGSYMKLNEEATAELNALAWSQGAITDTASASLVEKYRQMGDMVLTAMKENHAEQLASQQKMFDDSDVLTKEEEQKRMQKLQEAQLREIEVHNNREARILEIITTANKEKRTTTAAENAEMAKLNELSKTKAVTQLSKSEEEQKTILANMKEQKGVIRAEESAAAIKKSIETKKKVVKEAEKTYTETVNSANLSKNTLGGISQAEATAIIKEAERKKSETVGKANVMHADVIEAATAQAGDHADAVNKETGEVLSGWDKMYNGVIKAVNWITSLFGGKQFKVKGSVAAYGKPKASMQARYAKGTMHGTHPGGPAIVGEEGPELAHVPGMGTTIVGRRGPELLGNLPKGSAVLPNKQTESMLKKYGFPGYADGVGNWDVFDFIEKGASGAWDYLTGKFGIGDSLLPDGFMKDMGTSVTSSFKGMATDFIKDLFSKSDAGGNGPVSFGNLTKTSSFGMRFHPVDKVWKLHGGDDYGGKIGTAIKATTGGKVTSSGASGTGFGTMVKIKNGAHDYIYAHLSRAIAKLGSTVSKGDVIGALGNTGKSTGPHLHYEVRKNGTPVKPGGYATGGVITKEQLAWVGEGNKEEVIIPTGDKSQRKNAIQLLGVASEKLGVTAKAMTAPIPKPKISLAPKVNTKLESQVSDMKKILTLGNQEANIEVAEINKKAKEEAAKLAKRANEDIRLIQAKAKKAKRKLTAAENIRIQRLEEDSAAKIKKINTKSAAEVRKITQGANKQRLEEASAYIEEKKRVEGLSLIDEANLWRRSLSLFKVGSAERLEIQKNYANKNAEINDQVVRMNAEHSSKIKDIQDKLVADINAANQVYDNAFSERVNSYANFASIFEEVTLDAEVSGQQLMDNLKSQVTALSHWKNEFNELAGRKLDENLLEELRQLGPKAAAEIAALNTLTDAQLSLYSETYKTKSRLAREQAVKELQPLAQQTAAQIQVLQQVAQKELSELTKIWTKEIQGLLVTTNTAFKPLSVIGQDAVRGLIAGFGAMHGPLASEAQKLGKIVQDKLKDVFQIHSPSRWMENEIVGNLGLGFVKGAKSIKGSLIGATQNMSQWMTPDIPIQEPRKHTNAMKLLALAGKKISTESGSGNVSPSQMQSTTLGNGNNNQVVTLLQELIALIQNPEPQPMINQLVVDGRVMAEAVVDDVSQLLGGKTNLAMLMKGSG